jgi:hypothetical protein
MTTAWHRAGSTTDVSSGTGLRTRSPVVCIVCWSSGHHRLNVMSQWPGYMTAYDFTMPNWQLAFTQSERM